MPWLVPESLTQRQILSNTSATNKTASELINEALWATNEIISLCEPEEKEQPIIPTITEIATIYTESENKLDQMWERVQETVWQDVRKKLLAAANNTQKSLHITTFGTFTPVKADHNSDVYFPDVHCRVMKVLIKKGFVCEELVDGIRISGW